MVVVTAERGRFGPHVTAQQHAAALARLRESFAAAGVRLDALDDRAVAWLATLDAPAVELLIGLVSSAHAAGVDAGRGARATAEASPAFLELGRWVLAVLDEGFDADLIAAQGGVSVEDARAALLAYVDRHLVVHRPDGPSTAGVAG